MFLCEKRLIIEHGIVLQPLLSLTFGSLSGISSICSWGVIVIFFDVLTSVSVFTCVHVREGERVRESRRLKETEERQRVG